MFPKIVLDELPLSDERYKAFDYSAYFLYSLLGTSLVHEFEHGKFNSQLDIKLLDSRRMTLTARSRYQRLVLSEVKRSLDCCYSSWTGFHGLFFKDILSFGGHCYRDYEDRIEIIFSSDGKLLPFMFMLASYHFNVGMNEWSYSRCNTSIVICHKNEILHCCKIRNRYRDLLSYLLGFTDMTSNTNFPIWIGRRSFPSLHVGKTGIIAVLVCINEKSELYHNSLLRQRVMDSIDLGYLQKKLNGYLIADRFSVNCTVSRKNNQSWREKEWREVTLGYDDYYPNRRLVKLVSKCLLRNNLKAKLVKTKFSSPSKERIDLQLVLLSNPFNNIVIQLYQLVLATRLCGSKMLRQSISDVLNYYRGELDKDSCVKSLISGFICSHSVLFLGSVKSVFFLREKVFSDVLKERLLDVALK